MRKFDLLRIFVSVTVILCLCLAVSFAQEQKERRPTMAEMLRKSFEKKRGGAAEDIQGVGDEESGEEDKEFEQEMQEEQAGAETVDPNKPKDPFDVVERGGKDESREWIYGTQENRLSLSRQVQSQITAELNYIRKTAEAEGAQQTLAAIDKVITNRKARFARIETRIREERAKATQNQNSDTRQGVRGRAATGTGRGTTGTGRGGTTTGRTRGQQEAGPRGRMYQGQGQQGTRGRQNGTN
ncbi:MAG: hypothetical protein ACYTFM_07055 [Planctomycetota bacterium]